VAEASFESLVGEREALRSYVLVHAKSLRAFKEEGSPYYQRKEASGKPALTGADPIRHLTTTASCLESLDRVPVYEDGKPPPPCPRDALEVKKELQRVTDEFATAALEADMEKWRSESQKLVYSRVRTLPVILSLAEDKRLKRYGSALADHLAEVWKPLDVSDIRAQGIAERPDPEESSDEGYPPNAFHTYWAIRLLHEYKRKRFLPTPAAEIEAKRAVAQLWARRTLAAQTALISGDQQSFDAHQLAWALSADVLCRDDDGDRPTTADRQHVELYDAALAAFFGEQKDGHWRLYDPLFHYSTAGNAYCYTYETLAELLRLALRPERGRVLRSRLRKHSENLIGAWHYARETALELAAGGRGWSSGHHPHRTEPEGWATASVFSYLQNLRCLIGHWAAEEAKLTLQVQPAGDTSPEIGEETLEERGNTWGRKNVYTVGRQLAMLFLHPLQAPEPSSSPIEPDRPLVEQSRSAVLFGPPGTSKTTLIEALATALGWDYVEIHASHFLSEGLDSVPKMADSIFQKLMELDHCVILFDEIDELIRLRNDADSDPFGRFLTTSMLPKIAKLWSQRRVLFFVATNAIEAADPAIKRSQRFDAAIFVPPPSFEKKKKELEGIIGPVELSLAEVESGLDGTKPEDAALGVFALLRWDQIADLAHRIEVREREGEARGDALRVALGALGRELERADWRPPADEKDGDQRAAGTVEGGGEEDYPHRAMFERWRKQALEERRDYRRASVLRLDRALDGRRPEGWKLYKSNRRYMMINRALEGAIVPEENGDVGLTGDGWKAVDRDGIFSFLRE
jgi:ATPase family associated with various cellular activities (AAA)